MKHPKTIEELKKLRKPVRNVNIEQKEKLSKLDRASLYVSDNVGSPGFFLCILCWTILWLGWNMLAPTSVQFDPFPAFVLWLFISNMIQIFLMPLIMIAQNLQSKHAEARAEADFEINTKAELEIETILKHLESQNEHLLNILNRLDNKSDSNTGTQNF